MKIGIACYPTYGGSGIVATELGKNLARRGHEVHFISYAMPYRLTGFFSNILFHEVKVPDYPLFEYPPYALALASQIATVALNEKLDIIHAHYAIPHAVSACLAREIIQNEHQLKVVTTLHGTDITLVGSDPSFKLITQYGINQSNAVTAVSNYLKEATIKTFEPQVPIQVIYNFIDGPQVSKDDCRCFREKFAPNGEPILIHLSNFRPVKRVKDTIEITRLVKEVMPVKLVLLGDGPERAQAELLVKKYKLENDVFFLGKQEDVYCMLNIGDIFLMPSDSESFGLAALEAMSCGLPCVTSNAGGLPELNVHGVTGFTAPVGDVKTMSEYVLELIRTPGLLEKFSKQAKEHAFSNFHSDKIINQYIELYQSVLNK
jgi:N-acetyl-alpha-D-glucosaminyl L-malate synthase BshA